MASSGKTRIEALNTTAQKYVPVRIGAQLSANSLSVSLATDDGKLPSALDVDRLKITNVKVWTTTAIVEDTTLASEASLTSSVIDLDQVGGDSFHLYVGNEPVGTTNLSITIEQSFDNSNFFPDLPANVMTINNQHFVYTNVSRYVRFVITNSDAESTVITAQTGSFA